MVIRGANSDMLAPTTLDTMLSRRDELEVAVVPNQGHAPLLTEPKAIRQIAAFVASCDVSAALNRARPQMPHSKSDSAAASRRPATVCRQCETP